MNLNDKEEVIVEIWRKGDLSYVFGKLKGSAEELNKIADEHGWDD